MFFLDSLGFLSLTSLLIQCGLAWTFLAFFAVLPRDSVAMRRWQLAFAGLGIGLTAVAIRFALAHYHIAGPDTIAEGDWRARLYYGVYLAGKATFVWFLVGGVAALRQRAWPRGGAAPIAAVGAALAVGVALRSVESILLAQAPFVVVAFLYAARCLRRGGDEAPEIGRRVARGVFLVWAVVWMVYGLAASVVGPVVPDGASPWNIVLRANSFIDLTLQASLAAALIVVVMHDAQQAVLVAVQGRDRLRERVQRDEKLRALSTLVGGVAHEINNPLTAILGFADDLASGDKPTRDAAARIVREQAERCRGIVRRMSMLGGRTNLALEPVNMGEIVERVARGFQPQLARAGVAIELALDTAPGPLEADPVGLEQVVSNLIANAIGASPRGGRVVVTTRVGAESLHLVVVDQGPGVPVVDRARIFEPFWTSKAPGEGTGLGLAVADVLVKAHGGRIEVGDAVGGGAQFEVTLPLATPRPAPVGRPTMAALQASMPTLRVLVVDDDPAVRAIIARQATRHGWTAVPAASGEHALDMLVAEGAAFDAVVCDLRMPGLSGMGLHDELVRRAPWLLRRLLFVTGDLSSAEAAAFAGRCNAPILTKPFGASDLFGRLREVVGGA